MSKKTKHGKERKKQDKLNWIIREWDCHSLDEAKHLAREDQELNRLLRECGVRF